LLAIALTVFVQSINAFVVSIALAKLGKLGTLGHSNRSKGVVCLEQGCGVSPPGNF